ELALTGYTCADLFHQPALRQAARAALGDVVQKGSSVFSGLAVVGLPLALDDQLFNCSAVFQQGRPLGILPKSFIPNSNEVYEARWFSAASGARSRSIEIGGASVPFGTDLLFDGSRHAAGLVVGVEICEDLWVPAPPSSFQALAGASVLLNLSASNEIIGKA